MEDIITILKEHLNRYPQMRPQDVIKLLYQYEYGPGHMIRDDAMKLYELMKEWDETEADETMPLYENIGNMMSRVNIAKAKTMFTPEQINDLFVRTANIHRGSMADFMRDMKTIRRHLSELPVSFTETEYDEYLAWYRSEGYPSVHHSREYHDLYHPHYRVIFTNMIRSLEEDPS